MKSPTMSITALSCVESFYRLMLSGDPSFLDFVSDSVVTHQSPAISYGGVYEGKAALAKLLSEIIFPLLDAKNIRMVAPLLADETRVIGSFTVPVRSNGELLHVREECVVKNGRIVELHVFYFDPRPLGPPAVSAT